VKAITVRQPWGWAIMHAGKDVENRSRNIAGAYRGPVVIHAGLAKFEQDNMASREHSRLHGGETSTGIVFGAALGTADLVDVHTVEDCWHREFVRLASLYRNDRAAYDALPDNGAGGAIGKARPCSPWVMDEDYHLMLANPRPFPKPIPYRGALGLWRFPDHLLPEGWSL